MILYIVIFQVNMQKILQLVVFITFFSFSFLLILNPHVLAEPEMEHVPHHEHDHHHHDHNHGKGAFDEEHYHEGKHNPDADRKVILGMWKFQIGALFSLTI